MTTYAVFDRAAKDGLLVVPERFSWFAALLPPVFALAHGMWLELVGFVLVVMLLGAAAASIGDAAVFWLYVVFAAWIGFEANTFRRAVLRSRGWQSRGEVVAAGADVAEFEALRGGATP